MQNLSVKIPTQRHVPITVEMYHLMNERGAFHPDERVELIGGRIFDMSPIGSLHARCVNFLNAYLSNIFAGKFIVGVQNPILLDDQSEPQPDIALLEYREDFYKDELPSAADVRLIIEVADTSAEYDRGVKFPRYAAAGVSEAWLIDLFNERIEIHSDPTTNAYQLNMTYVRGQSIQSKNIPTINLAVNDILG